LILSGVLPVVTAQATTLERAERLAERLLPERTPKRRMLVIVNPYATTVSDKLRNLVVYALQSRYAVEAVDTEKRDHATQLCREAASEGYDVVVAFGGDGTVNEAANGLAGSGTPLTALPGGSTNVWCRTLGIPNDVVDATEHLLRMAADFRPRSVDAGLVNDRLFVFGSGIGLDASVAERVDAHPHRKARLGAWYYTWAALVTFNRHYLISPPRVRVQAGGRSVDAVTVIIQNSDPFTYFRRRPIRVCEGGGLDTGTISLAALERATVLELPTLIPRIFTSRSSSVLGQRQVKSIPSVERATVQSLDGGTFPLQVDGDYLGEFDLVEYGVAPRALVAVS
jgi:diacylglycerol kinase family enzyme